MKSILISFALFFTIINNVFAQDTITLYYNKKWEQVYSKQDAVFYRKAFLDNSNIWKVCDYYKSFKLQMTGSYKSKKLDVRHGCFVYYFENGLKESEGNYVNDKKEGKWIYWFENGQIESTGYYKDGKWDSDWEYWHETGEKKSKGKCINGKIEGLWIYWYQNNKIEAEEFYKNGSLKKAKYFFKNGILRCEGEYKNGKEHGKWTYWNIHGRITYIGSFNKGKREGFWIRKFRNDEFVVLYKNGIEVKKHVGIIRRDL